ncbi:hypothetical protein GCM10010358_24870 [Streptomyces minutiscleroticus]|uniref:Uncharacterized protein n=1 Tax=Streptomyces minutiscleroticus TaxID=68238 RepID=A0A918KN38_9ACTN|nr:hypothetical protein GCM10010358_24870 [Streptomyces minutiscleroticus]
MYFQDGGRRADRLEEIRFTDVEHLEIELQEPKRCGAGALRGDRVIDQCCDLTLGCRLSAVGCRLSVVVSVGVERPVRPRDGPAVARGTARVCCVDHA